MAALSSQQRINAIFVAVVAAVVAVVQNETKRHDQTEQRTGSSEFGGQAQLNRSKPLGSSICETNI
jgi:hypothetical protein